MSPLFSHPFYQNLSVRNERSYACWLWQQYRIHLDLEMILPEACNQSEAVRYLFAPAWWPLERLRQEAHACGPRGIEWSPCRATCEIHDMLRTVSAMSPVVFAGVTYALRYIHDVVFEDGHARDMGGCLRNQAYWQTFHEDLESLGAKLEFKESVVSGVVVASENVANLWSEISGLAPCCPCQRRAR